MRSTVRPLSMFAVGWAPLLLIFLSLPMVFMMAVTPVPEKTVGQLMLSDDCADKFGLSSIFTEMDLQKGCTSPLIKTDIFPKSLVIHYESSICTVIYNVTRDLKSKYVGVSDIFVKNLVDKINKSNNNSDMYKVWKNVTVSPSLSLLMKHLNETTKWKSVCFNFNNDLFPYCKFLHLEVLLLIDTTPAHIESTSKVNSGVSVPDKIVKSSTNNITSEIPKDILGDNSTINDFDANDNKDLIEENEDLRNSDIEVGKQSDIQIPIEPKALDSYDKNLNEDYSITTLTDIKLPAPIYVSSNKLTNQQEESHFLLFFIIGTVLSMMFYLALYNKKKILALLIEGRRSTNHRRRPNSTSYSKVETDDGSTVY